MEVSASHRENPSQKYSVYCSMVLETPYTSVEDQLVAVVINSCKFEPDSPQNISGFSFILGTDDFEIGSFPHLSVDPRNLDSGSM